MLSRFASLPPVIRCAAIDSTARLFFLAGIVLAIVAMPSSGSQPESPQNSASQANAGGDANVRDEPSSQMPEELGVQLHASRAYPGYNLITTSDHATYLFDNDGRVVHSWPGEIDTHLAYLLDNGHLFRFATADNLDPRFRGPAKGGRFLEFDWDGNVLWDFEYHSQKRQPHHDAIRLPNGNVLMICWEMIEGEEAIARGRRPEGVKDSHLQPDSLVEVRPTGRTTGEVVWEWRSWDHLIQDFDRTKPDFGKVADHPERIDVNYDENEMTTNPDWMHINAVAYNPELDQIALSSPRFNEIWIIDHGTTTEEARGHTGGRWGKGGDILYRWGNPAAYRGGTAIDRRLFFQHNIHWIAKGLPGEGHLLVFNNGGGREPEEHSSVDEFEPPIDKAGNYVRREHAPFGPDTPLWSYVASNKTDFYSWFISGAQRLPNGNTLINAGAIGVVFEVTPEKEIVWRFSNPFSNQQRAPDAAPPAFQAITGDARGGLGISEDQSKQLDEIDKELNAKLDEVLDVEQKRVLTEPDDVDLSSIPAGEYLFQFKNEKLNLTEDQAGALQKLAQEFDSKIASIFTAEQKQAIADLKANMAQRPARPQLRARNTLFRAMRFGLDHPAFIGRTLTPGKTLVEIQQQRERAAVAQQ